jgi:S-formylglutathione hydrolase FrmB
VSAKPSALKRFNEYIKAGMGKTVWVGGCNSWYLDADGDPAMWPYTWKQWVKEMSEPVMEDFNTQKFAIKDAAGEEDKGAPETVHYINNDQSSNQVRQSRN